MELAEIGRILLLALLVGCVIAVNVTRSLLQAVLVFMAYSSFMCLLWILMESPDLAITEAAVGAGVDGLFLEVHDNPPEALSDKANAIPLADVEGLWRTLHAINAARG